MAPGLLPDLLMQARSTSDAIASAAEFPDFHDEGHGYDVFGLHPPTARRVLRWTHPIYARYFRVASYGAERIPTRGAAILAGNHSGTLPMDGVMLWADVAQHTGRALRLVGDWFIVRLPIISTLFARTGVVNGTHSNVNCLLERGELIAIFPEGTAGVGKPFRERYQLQEWRVGHVEHAIRHRAPIVPFAIIGAEESWPVLFKVPVQLFGAPYLPVPMTLLPLPWPYAIHYGAPIEVYRRYAPEDADDPEAVLEAAAEVRDAVAALIDEGLARRRRT